MPSDKRYRKPRCPCTATLNPDGLCPHRCDLYLRPFRRVANAQRGRKPDQRYDLLSDREVDEAMARVGVPPLYPSPRVTRSSR
jgi:hypothetical protein